MISNKNRSNAYLCAMVVTLVSDWNKSDYYTGALQGALTGLATLQVISQQINSFDVRMGMFVLRRVFPHYPAGTVHIMAVQAQSTDTLPMCLVFYDGHYFITVNDGRLSLLFDHEPQWVRAICASDSSFSELECYVKGVRAIVADKIEEWTLPARMKTEVVQCAVAEKDFIVGQVIYIDSYGNAITNITRSVFEKSGAGRPFHLYVQGPYTKITHLSTQYGGVRPGELIALFNSADLLEIAVYLGNLAVLESLSLYAEIQIQFHNG